MEANFITAPSISSVTKVVCIFASHVPTLLLTNGKTEQKIQTIKNVVRTMLAQSSMPPSFWPHALQMATYLHNILPSKILDYKSPA